MWQIWYWLWQEALCTRANTDEGCGTRPLKHTHTVLVWPRAVNYTTIKTQEARDCVMENSETEYERNREEELKKMSTLSVEAQSVWERNDGPWKTPWCFPCIHMAWLGEHTVLQISPPPSSTSFHPSFFCQRACPLNSPSSPDALCCTSSDRRV